MKKVPQSFSESFTLATIYLDDINNIIDLFEGEGIKYEIVINNNLLDDRNELDEFDNMQEIKITTREPYTSIDIDKDKVWLFSTEDTIIVQGLFSTIRKCFTKIKSPSMVKEVLEIGFALGLIFIIKIVTVDKSYFSKYMNIAVFMVLLLLGFSVVKSILSLGNGKVKIYAIKRKNKPNFWKKNKDLIVVGIITSTLAAIITFILTKIFS
ncbi:hypothetical protein KAU32_11210 [bacterium]|nr:hypothetical protein [bacterium]